MFSDDVVIRPRERSVLFVQHSSAEFITASAQFLLAVKVAVAAGRRAGVFVQLHVGALFHLQLGIELVQLVVEHDGLLQKSQLEPVSLQHVVETATGDLILVFEFG